MAQELSKYILGAGKLYFDPENSNGDLTGEIYLGDTPGFEMPVSSDIIDTWSSDGKVAEREDLAVTRIVRNATLRCKNISMYNLSLFVIGDHSTLAEAGGAVTDEAVNGVQQGRYYQLGVTSSNPTGVRTISAVTVTGAGGTPSYAVDTDYTVDLALGRIYIVPGGSIADDANILVDYTKTAENRDHVAASDLGAKYGALRYIADNTRGPNRDLYVPRLLLRPDGSLAFKSRENYMEMQFQAEFLKRDSLAQAYIDGRAV
jgi:hypothetical protein